MIMAVYYKRMNADKLEIVKLLTTSIMPLGLLTVVVLVVILFGITTATESRGGRRRRRIPARPSGAHAQLEAHARKRCS